jgi:hypothetical protein
LRGFSPTADWVGTIDVESFCEQILAIGKQFQEANSLASVYITEQGGWHALSNREQVARYLTGRYINSSISRIPLIASCKQSYLFPEFILNIRLNTFVINPYWKKITGSKKVEEKA